MGDYLEDEEKEELTRLAAKYGDGEIDNEPLFEYVNELILKALKEAY